jgi:DNA-damage-inducible protein J
MKTSIINARVEPELKSQVEKIFQEIGLSATQAITLFYKQIVFYKGLPFDVKIPNSETEIAIKDAQENRNTTNITLQELEDMINARIENSKEFHKGYE